MKIIDELKIDRNQARTLNDPNADLCFFALALDNQASVRTLVLREIVDHSFRVFINSHSPKGQLVQQGAGCQMLIWYHSLQKQYRITGNLVELDPEIIATNWQRRPLGSKYLDHVYVSLGAQSSPIDNRQALTNKVSELRNELGSENIEPPEGPIGLALESQTIECLDLNNQDRTHDRRIYNRVMSEWQEQILIP